MNKCTFNYLVVAFVLLMPCLAFALPGAHDPASGNPYACNSCHVAGATMGNMDSNYTTNVCLRCHLSGDAGRTPKLFKPEDYADPFKTTTLTRGSALQTSHKWFGSDNVPAAGALPPSDNSINGLNKNANFVAGGLFCARCHNVHGTSGGFSNEAPYLRYPNDSDQLCRNCHRLRDTNDHTTGTHPVNVSYTSASVKAKITAGSLLAAPTYNPAATTGQVKLVNNKVVCSTCHKTHNSDSRTSTFDPYSTGQTFGQLSSSKGYLLRVSPYGKTASDVNICTNCHAGKVNHNLSGRSSTVPVQCNDCHSGHVEYDPTSVTEEKVPNVNLVRRFIQYTTAGRINKRILYRSTTTKEYYNATGNGVCQACHNPPTDHYVGNTLSGAFPESGHLDCTSCHTHTETTGAFSVGGGGCNSCHGQPPKLNAAGADGRAAGYARYTDESTTPHFSHTNYGYVCNDCHNGKSPAHPAAGSYTYVFPSPTGTKAGAAATYTPAPTGDSTCNTVYCHSDGNGGYKAGQNAVGWNSGKAGSIIGSGGECTTCHDNTAIITGSHPKHVSAPLSYTCATCHAATIASGSTIITTKANHANGVKDVQLSGTTNPPATGSYVSAGKTCATVACHSNGKSGVPVDVPTWGTATTGDCGSCHLTAAVPALATGSHTTHFTVVGSTVPTVVCVKCHTYNGETAAPHVNGTVDITAGCATTTCHGSIASPTWGNNTANATCTKCHGTGTVSVSVANREVVAPSLPAGTDTGNVSANAKTGAHQTHILYTNGLSAQGTKDDRCIACHGALPGAGTHANGSSDPTSTFNGLAKGTGTYPATFTAAGTTCSVYCHNPAAATGGTLNPANAGTGILPSWTDSNYISNAPLKTELNCNRCHKSPGTVAGTIAIAGTDHSSIKIADDCAGCHGHNGDISGSAGQRHMDGIKYGNGACDTCHGYPPMTATDLGARAGGWVNAKVEVANGGGHHKQHLLPTVVAAQGFTPCLPCHPDSGLGWHNQGGGAVATANVNVFYAADTGYRFDDSRSKRYKADKTCSNVSCHFQPTVAW